MGDTLDDPWWEPTAATDTRVGSNSSPDVSGSESMEEAPVPVKALQQRITPELVSSTKTKQPVAHFPTAEKEQAKNKEKSEAKPKRRKKKKISDVLAKSSPKPGTAEDLQKLLTQHFGAKRSVIELEELKLPVCPKWAKLRKNHKEKKSVVMLIICSSALRCLKVIKSITAFKGDGKVMKLFAKHIKIQEQVKRLEKGVTHLAVGTPARIKALIEQDGLTLTSLKYLILDWNWRDLKLRRLIDIPEIRKEIIELLELKLIKLCREGSLKLGLF